MKRVVVTGIGCLSPLGVSWQEERENLLSYRSAVSYMPDWEIYEGLNTKLAASVPSFSCHYPRKKTRSMGRVALLATYATEMALKDADLLNHPVLTSGNTGIAYGSSSGSPDAIKDFLAMLVSNSTDSIKGNTYIKMMPHTTAANIAVFFGMQGRTIPTSSACTSGSLAIGMAYETIRQGQQILMVAGGAEELSPTQAAVFDTLFATSTRNDAPTTTPSPFDAERDGLVIGEGAATFALEELEHAKARGAKIHAEVVGFGTNSDGIHLTQPTAETMKIAIQLALRDAALDPKVIGYVNAHGTATDLGDIAESQATLSAMGRAVPISSLKSYMGHTLGACGSIEAAISVRMMNENWFAPTINLHEIDPQCADLDYITDEKRPLETEYMMNNNFAFGGMNTSLIFRKWGS